MIELDDSQWFVVPKPNHNADIRLFCLPYAGGAVATYLPWVEQLPGNIEMVFIQPPGRGARMLDAGFNNMADLIESLIKIIVPFLNKPYAIFGHSMGARIGFELIRKIQSLELNKPSHFIASGSGAPNIKEKNALMHTASNDDFKARLRQLNATPDAVLNNQELMDLVLPSLRNDFQLSETYYFNGTDKTSCPMTVLRGVDDEWIDETSASHWRKFSGSDFEMIEFMGGHMFIEHNRKEVVDVVANTLAHLVSEVETMA